MTQQRLEYFKSLPYLDKYKLTSEDFTKSEMLEIINETILSEEDTEIAICRFVNKMTIDKIADKFVYDSRSINKRVKEISHKLKITCTRLFS